MLTDVFISCRVGEIIGLLGRNGLVKRIKNKIKMKENKYDDERFFEQYSHMSRSVMGLRGAGEWHVLRELLPDMNGKRVLDLGCGYGWHCKYAAENGAASVVGIDLSQKMIDKAREINADKKIDYRVMAVEDFDYSARAGQFDLVISSLTLHYLSSFERICGQVAQCLARGGEFIFSVEHPIFTAHGAQEWHRNADGEAEHWPVDNYFGEGLRHARFLGEDVVKYHKTLTTYVNGLIESGFTITKLIEPQPEASMLDTIEGMRDELRRPMMLIVAARKN